MNQYRLWTRLAIAVTFILTGLGSFQEPVLGSYIYVERFVDIRIYGVLMIAMAVWTLVNTYQRKRLALLNVLPYFAYVGGFVALMFFTNVSVPLQTLGAYFLASVTILFEAIREWG